jgi:hypothetical protein
MSAVDETIVREFFEARGFLVCQRRKYVGRAGDEEVNFVVVNPKPVTAEESLPFELTAESLPRVGRAVVAVKGWHTEIFSPGVLTHQPKIFRFVEKKAVDEAHKLVGGDGLLKLLVIPGLPREAKLREKSIELLRLKGVDGVISFPVILQHLISTVAVNRNYQKSELLQTLRLLKNYDLLREPQMELKLKPQRKKRSDGVGE